MSLSFFEEAQPKRTIAKEKKMKFFIVIILRLIYKDSTKLPKFGD